MEASTTKPLRTIEELDGVRGIAILVVVVYHFAARVPWSSGAFDRSLQHLAEVGWVGVELFFVLSGFLITGILSDTREDSRYFRSFYARRVLRIVPAYYLLLAAGFWLAPAVLGSAAKGLTIEGDQQWWFWSFTSNWLFASEPQKTSKGMYLWSLSVEEQFYVLWPCVVWVLSSRSLALFCSMGCVMTWIARPLLVFSGVEATSVYTMTITHADGLMLGSLLSLAWQYGRVSQIARFAPTLITIAVLGIAIIAAYHGRFVFFDSGVGALGLTLVAIASFAFVAILLEGAPSSAPNRLCSSPVLQYIGKLSFGIYLFHVPAAAVAAKPILSGGIDDGGVPIVRLAVYCLAATALTFLAALASWHCVEHPFLRLKKYFPYIQSRRSREHVPGPTVIDASESLLTEPVAQ